MTKQAQVVELLNNKREVLLNDQVSNGICYDGIVNELTYSNVVVLMKETNGRDFDGKMPNALSDWDYYKWLKDQQVENKPEMRMKGGKWYEEKNVFYHSTFRKLCYWLSLLFDVRDNGKANPEKFLQNGQVDVGKVRRVLDKVAIVNLKKSWGDKQTDSKELAKYVENEKIARTLREQMSILEPKIVLCCSPVVYDLATKVYLGESSFSVPSKSIPGKNIEYTLINGTVYVNFFHPQYYRYKEEQFSDFAEETFEQIKEYIKSI